MARINGTKISDLKITETIVLVRKVGYEVRLFYRIAYYSVGGYEL